MSVRIEKYTEDKKRIWNDFVKKSNNGTLFHDLDFLSYHPENRFNEHHLMFYRKDNLIGVMPMALSETDGKKIAKSPYGGSYGSIITDEQLKYRHSEEIIASLINHLNGLGIQDIYITPPPFFYSRKSNCYLEFALLRNNFEILKREITSAIPLDYEGIDPFVIFEGRARTSVRRAKEAGVIVKESADFESFYEILVETKNRHDVLPTHSLEELLKLNKLCQQSLKLDIAYVGDNPIAGILYFVCNSQVVLTFYICHKSGFEKYHAVNFLVYQGIIWAKEKGFKYFDMGTTTLNMIPNAGLFMFKESFGSVGYFRDTYKLEL